MSTTITQPPLHEETRAINPRNFLALLFVINLLNYIDRNAVTGLLEPIRKDLGASDAQMGMVGFAFLATYALLPPIFGWLGDRKKRTKIIAASASFWSFATAAAGLSRSVPQLALTRAAVGVGEASYMANAPSLIADVFPLKKRGGAMSLFYTASPMGSALGVALAGALAALYGWRSACFLVAIPGLIVAYLIYRTPEPVRGAHDDEPVGAAVPFRSAVAALARNRGYVFLTLAYAGQVFAQNAIEFWLPTVLQRDKAIPIAQANASYGAMVMIAGLIGPVMGSLIGDSIRKSTKRAYYYVSAASAALTALPLIALALTTAFVPLFASVFAEALLGNMAVGLAMTIAVSVVAPGIRATATAVLLTSVHVLGDVISQPLVGRISTTIERGGLTFLPAMFGLDTTQHLSTALITVCVPAACFAGVFYVIASRQKEAMR